MGNHSFEIKTSIDFFIKLKEDYLEFNANKLSSKCAINCAMTAWHLAEWIYVEYNALANINQFQTIEMFKNNIKSQCPSLQIMQDITNGTKHFFLRKQSTIKTTELHEGSFSDDFSRDFDISGLEIELTDGTKLYFEDEIEKVKIFWEGFFKNELGIIV